jgi:hypothetical protein
VVFHDEHAARLRRLAAAVCQEGCTIWPVKKLLIVYHTGGVKTAQMAEAVKRGALA